MVPSPAPDLFGNLDDLGLRGAFRSEKGLSSTRPAMVGSRSACSRACAQFPPMRAATFRPQARDLLHSCVCLCVCVSVCLRVCTFHAIYGQELS